LIQRIRKKQRFPENVHKSLLNYYARRIKIFNEVTKQTICKSRLQSTHTLSCLSFSKHRNLKPQTDSQRLLTSEPATRTTLTRDVMPVTTKHCAAVIRREKMSRVIIGGAAVA
jgi:hypothetical protein